MILCKLPKSLAFSTVFFRLCPPQSFTLSDFSSPVVWVVESMFYILGEDDYQPSCREKLPLLFTCCCLQYTDTDNKVLKIILLSYFSEIVEKVASLSIPSYRPEITEDCGPLEIRQLMQNCWLDCADDRPDFGLIRTILKKMMK